VGTAERAIVTVQKLIQAQMDDRRKRGLCYSCDSKWTKGHVCAAPKFFLIEEVETLEDGNMVRELEDGEMEETPEISLIAITGTPNPRTMKLVGVLKNQQVVVLIDSGSAHNFVDAHLAKLLGLQVQFNQSLRVKIANGQDILSPSRSKELPLKIQKVVFQLEFYILSLAGCDIVLGIQWLRILGPILWDFQHLAMKFQYGQMDCVLQGLLQGPQLSLEDAADFKFFTSQDKGVLLQLLENADVYPTEVRQGTQSGETQTIG
jgi:hypothetical protein